MKKVLFSLSFLLLCLYSPAQTFVGKGNLKIGLKVSQGKQSIPIDRLCQGFEAETRLPIALVTPEGSSLVFFTDSLKARPVSLLINGKKSDYFKKGEKERPNAFSRSSSAGSKNRYTFIDESNGDSLSIRWQVGYAPVQLLDLYPAEKFNEFMTFQMQNLFSDYPDSSTYDWPALTYIESVNERGIPIEPQFPHHQNGFCFLVNTLSEKTLVELKGYHEEPQPYNQQDPYDLFLYENLPPGEYEFVVKPYKDAPESLWLQYAFSIQKPWWQSLYAQLSILGSVLSLIFLAIILNILSIQKRREKDLRVKQQLSEAELKAIRAQLNPHFLFNALSSILNLVNQEENERASHYLTRLARLLRQILSASERQFHDLEEELALIKLYLEIEQLRFSFHFDIHLAESVDTHVLVPVMLLQPFVENAVKHGIFGKENGEIILDIQMKAKHLNIKILDNGEGLRHPNATSKGLLLSKNRIQYLNQLYSGKASLDIQNRDDASGVIVNLNLPLE